MSRFAKFAWFNVGYTIVVILWGAVVRITGSGAGCGNHWPACNDEILHRPEQVETLIELSHRLTSALAGFFVLILLLWAFRKSFEHNQKFIRWMSAMTFVFILVEGGLGAALVRFELVADNASVARAFVIALHLVNTLILLGFATLVAWGASRAKQIRFSGFGRQGGLMIGGLIGFIFLSAIGAVTALGDTLFPAETLIEGLRQDFDPAASFLIQLRIWHPIIAIVLSVYLFGVGYMMLNKKHKDATLQLERLVNGMFAMIVIQLVGGFINVILLAPAWMQVIHLLLADILWIIIVMLTAQLLTQEQTQRVAISKHQRSYG